MATNFAELLGEYTRGRTLESVAVECARRGTPIGRVTLSRYRSGDRLPKDDASVRAIAEVCERDPGPLLLLAQVQREPERVLEMIMAAVSGGDSQRLPRTLEELTERLGVLPKAASHTVLLELKLDGRTVASVSQSFASPNSNRCEEV